MAWRIAANVIRGEVDNTEQGVVRGRIWLAGFAEPIVLELKGNACPDLAGCALSFRNPAEGVPFRDEAKLAMLQQGTAGDMTASRKVRILDTGWLERKYLQKETAAPPDKFGNALYLEWYSRTNGRVVIESTDFQIEISPPTWRLSPEQESQRQAESAQGFANFLGQVDKAVNAASFDPPEDRPWDEFDYEKFLRESDARTEKYGELLDKYGHSPEAEELVNKEMGWTSMPNPGDDEISPEEEEDLEEEMELDFDEAMEIEPDPETEGVDWVRDETGHVCHPLYLRSRKASHELWVELKDAGFDELKNPELEEFLTNWHILNAKLAGALNSLGYGFHEGGFVVACLKRTLPLLQNTLGALEKISSGKLLPAEKITGVRYELFSTREEILRLMEDFRGRSSEE